MPLKALRWKLDERLQYYRDNNLLVEAQRLEQRTRYDLEMMQELGYCSGIENYRVIYPAVKPALRRQRYSIIFPTMH